MSQHGVNSRSNPLLDEHISVKHICFKKKMDIQCISAIDSPMRPSPMRHTLAVLRSIIGLTQKEMAALAECSTPTIQAIELGKLRLSPKLGTRISVHSGVGLVWLMKNEVAKPAVDNEGSIYTKDTFEKTQARIAMPPTTGDAAAAEQMNCWHAYHESLRYITGLFLHAYKTNQLAMGQYKVAAALMDVAHKLRPPVESQNFDEYWIWKSMPSSEEFVKIHALVQHFKEQTEVIFQQRLDATSSQEKRFTFEPGGKIATVRFRKVLSQNNELSLIPNTPRPPQPKRATKKIK